MKSDNSDYNNTACNNVTDRSFDISINYPLISGDNLTILQAFCNNATVNCESDESFAKIIQNIKCICSQINDSDVPPFSEWDCGTVQVYFGNMGYSYNKTSRIIKMIKEILCIAKCKNDVSNISANSFLGDYKAGLYTFNILNDIMKAGFSSYRPYLDWNVMNDISTTIIICYLEWIGFSRDEISKLKCQDYDRRFGAVILNNGLSVKRKNITEPEIEEYLNNYINSTTYLQYNKKYGKKICKYGCTDTLVKCAYDDTVISKSIIDNYILKVPAIFGISANDIWISGRLDEMYVLDKIKSIKIVPDNLDLLCKRLDLSLPQNSNYRDSSIGKLLMMYDSYKRGRELYNGQN